MEFKDKTIHCRDCNKDFIWSSGEQQFFYDKGFTQPPIRCPECRKKKKERHEKKQTPQVLSPDKMYEIKCKVCGKISEIPFQPEDPTNILCATCFEKERKVH